MSIAHDHPPGTAGSGRWRSLDGLRAIAVLSVMLYHLQQPGLFPGGYVGVDIFFVLSGFLITDLLVSENRQNGRVDLRAFYTRRALRLLPALAIVVAVVVAAVLLIRTFAQFRPDTLKSVPYVVLYTANWRFTGSHIAGLSMLGHTWSLSIEEQYYVIWPIVMLWAWRRWKGSSRLVAWISLAVVVEWVARPILARNGMSWELPYYSTFLHSDGLLVGSALALLLKDHQPLVAGVCSRPAAALSALALAYLVLKGHTVSNPATPLWITIAVAATAVLIGHLATDTRPLGGRVLGHRWSVWIGRRSYGLYLWHIPVYLGLGSLPWLSRQPVGDQELVLIATSFAIAGASYRFVEQPFLRLKTRFERVAVGPRPPTSLTHTSEVRGDVGAGIPARAQRQSPSRPDPARSSAR